jgi:formamidopyrimidine-DNA glycosylase
VEALSGARVIRVERRGKHQLVHLDDGRVIHVHFRMNGDWVLGRRGEPLPRFARAVLDFQSGARAVLEDSRALSTVDVHAKDAPPSLDLGPEPHDERLTAATLRTALSHRRTAIKVALLDQRIIAGLGNIYASESLWRAKIDPRAMAASLAPATVATLLRAIRAVIVRATGGRYTNAENARLDVYDREGKPCRRCGGTIRRIVQGGRSTYFCPRCQRTGRARINRAPRSERS